jgi:tetratricopeptide (TPR) repeat protein
MKRTMLIGIVSLILTVVFVSSSLQASEKLQIRIWTDKIEYLTREPVFVHYEVKNITDSSISLNLMGLSDYFLIKNQDGREFDNRLLSYYAVMNPNTLKSSETYSDEEEISDKYGLIEPGEYSCFIQMPPGHFSPSPETKSNLLKIKIKEPEGVEKEALELFLEAEKLRWVSDKDTTKIALGFSKYLELVDKYPGSVYAPKSLRTAWGTYTYSKSPDDRRKTIPVCIRLIEKYPNSHYFILAFTEIADTYKILKDKEGAINAMNELIEKHPNTKISERAEYWLEQIEKWEFK